MPSVAWVDSVPGCPVTWQMPATYYIEARNADGASVTIDAMPLALVRVCSLGPGLEP